MGSDQVPEEAGNIADTNNSCFSTSYHSCSKEQIIDLYKLGIPQEVMDKHKPHIFIQDW